jgi:anti-sigma factor RsiW
MSTDHERMNELLPWYVNSTLDRDEAARVEEHLGSCAACRSEVARVRQLSATVRAEDDAGWAASPPHFARLLANVDASEEGAAPLWQRLRKWIRATPRPVRFALALQSAAIIALAAVETVGPGHVYETLSRAPATAPSSRARLHVVFAPDMSEGELRELLQGAQAVIVDGPSAAGVYTIELAIAASEQQKVAQVAGRIARQPKVRFAAPVAR